MIAMALPDPRRTQPWRPGSFTKNFSWGPKSHGLKQLYQSIRVGFDNTLADVPREVFRERLRGAGRPDYIPLNFFLYNKIVDDVDYIIVDELVFQAITEDHSPRFDKLALFTFVLSLAGRWTGSKDWQNSPALWAHYYVRNRVNSNLGWNTDKVSANDIEDFVRGDKRYTGKTARKLATNLNYLFSNGHLADLQVQKIERWWVDSLFLSLDRIIEDAEARGDPEPRPATYAQLLDQYGFSEITGPLSREKSFAIRHLVSLYEACGGISRFSDDVIKQRTLALPDVEWIIANDHRPGGAVHPSNPRILKSIPRSCAILAVYAGFEFLDPEELETFDPVSWVREYTRKALAKLRASGTKPIMTSEELMKLTRDK
ncbi:hypothetical protein [Brevundimonas diminuta]|uniref:hypothetical protein n=1 Tax=Brevundimonas diminuta TaxID=293 RepID=UPI0030FB00D4